jgi:peptidoglycan/LPS O-acetylase OafA/YrhL
MFFSLSGFLVTRSLIEGRSVSAFIMRRIGRIVPGFLVASAVGCLIVGPLTTGDITNYFRSQNWPLITSNALALKQVGVADMLDGNPVTLVHGTQLLLFDTKMSLSPLWLFAISLGLTSVVALMIWKFVERPSLMLVRNWERRSVGRHDGGQLVQQVTWAPRK